MSDAPSESRGEPAATTDAACENCGGAGEVGNGQPLSMDLHGNLHGEATDVCPTCAGSGRVSGEAQTNG